MAPGPAIHPMQQIVLHTRQIKCGSRPPVCTDGESARTEKLQRHPGDPASLDRHGNPNTLTRDVGASSFSQGCSAQTCLVQVERFDGEPPPVRAFEPPRFVARPGPASGR